MNDGFVLNLKGFEYPKDLEERSKEVFQKIAEEHINNTPYWIIELRRREKDVYPCAVIEFLSLRSREWFFDEYVDFLRLVEWTKSKTSPLCNYEGYFATKNHSVGIEEYNKILKNVSERIIWNDYTSDYGGFEYNPNVGL